MNSDDIYVFESDERYFIGYGTELFALSDEAEKIADYFDVSCTELFALSDEVLRDCLKLNYFDYWYIIYGEFEGKVYRDRLGGDIPYFSTEGNARRAIEWIKSGLLANKLKGK